MTDSAVLGLGLAALVLAPPLAMALAGAIRGRGAGGSWDAGLTVRSALTYALAFNLAFFVQELFLVLPKALTPGLKPTLFHNNHDWSGHHPLERLFQGTGAAATVLMALGCALWLQRRPPRSAGLRLFALWLVFACLMQALPQVVLGAVFEPNDVGQAMAYFGLPTPAKLACAVAAIVAIALAGRWLAGRFAALAPAGAAGPGFMARIVLLPAALGTLIVLPFRLPGGVDQVALVPVAVALIGGLGVQAWAGRPAAGPPVERGGALWPWLIALVTLLAVFQLALRPGVHFY